VSIFKLVPQITVPWMSECGPGVLPPSSAVHATSNSDVGPQNPTHYIILSEDPQCAVEINDDEDGGIGDRIGEEDADENGNDENDDEKDPADGDLPPPDKPPCIC
jgi:hypothetical protein